MAGETRRVELFSLLITSIAFINWHTFQRFFGLLQFWFNYFTVNSTLPENRFSPKGDGSKKINKNIFRIVSQHSGGFVSFCRLRKHRLCIRNWVVCVRNAFYRLVMLAGDEERNSSPEADKIIAKLFLLHSIGIYFPLISFQSLELCLNRNRRRLKIFASNVIWLKSLNCASCLENPFKGRLMTFLIKV